MPDPVLKSMVNRHASWLEAGVEGPVISSRVRLARNIEIYPFPNRASSEERRAVWEQVSGIFEPAAGAFYSWEMAEMAQLDRELLFERHLISQELAEKQSGCGVVVAADEKLSVMINEEDHLRIQSLRPGLQLLKAWEVATQIDDELEKNLDYAFSPRLGYLTSCPSNMGTGLRASVMMHLPGLVLLNEMEPVINGISKIGLAVRGLWGEGTEAIGNMFQISNQMTLGQREEEIIHHLEEIVGVLVESEKNARIRLVEDQGLLVFDHVERAKALLRSALLISSSEALNLLSALRLGVDLGLVQGTTRRALDRLFVSLQPAHLQKAYGEENRLASEERDQLRAEKLREFMSTI